MRQITISPSFAEWQRAARVALRQNLLPHETVWEEQTVAQASLAMFDEIDEPPAPDEAVRIPRAFLDLAQRAACHRSGEQWSLLYRLLWRITHGERQLLQITVDPDVYRLLQMDKAIRRDMHKMRAFVRFREIETDGRKWYVAWFEPGHRIVERNAPFFRDRFAGMCWSILTPDQCAHWDGQQLRFTDGVQRTSVPGDDPAEALWLTYYSSIFNPARVKIQAMQSEMPKKYWKNLPEAALIPTLIQEAPGRAEEMIRRSSQDTQFSKAAVPISDDLQLIGEALHSCTACPLYRNATQAVFGEGSKDAEIVFVGEQPGDQEDHAGRPFVGPAGQLFDRALADAGIDRNTVYLTNAVKHFKWEPRGKRRLHAKPGAREIAACRPWLEAELTAIQPKVLVLLGGTATHSLLGKDIRVLRDRGNVVVSEFCKQTMITLHPSAILRSPDESVRDKAYTDFVSDLTAAAALLRA